MLVGKEVGYVDGVLDGAVVGVTDGDSLGVVVGANKDASVGFNVGKISQYKKYTAAQAVYHHYLNDGANKQFHNFPKQIDLVLIQYDLFHMWLKTK